MREIHKVKCPYCGTENDDEELSYEEATEIKDNTMTCWYCHKIISYIPTVNLDL